MRLVLFIMHNKKDGFCIVAHGGGVISAYHAGVIKALKEKFGFHNLHRIVTSSGAAATYSYLVSGQGDKVANIWINLVKDKRFINFFKFPPGKGIINIDFVADDFVRKKCPLNVNSLKKSKIELDIGVTDANTGKAKFFSNTDKINFYELLRATCAIPYFYGKRVVLNGHEYYDGTIAGVKDEKVLNQEKNIIFIHTTPDKPAPKLLFFRKILRKILVGNESKELQEAIWKMMECPEEEKKFVEKIKEGGRNVAVIRPSNWLPMNRIDNRLSRLKKIIEQGYYDTINNKELEEFFNQITTNRKI
jgi:predicted patatin/cPLA2 family phospholipase